VALLKHVKRRSAVAAGSPQPNPPSLAGEGMGGGGFQAA
jgi:hypothetical protein